MTADHRQRGLNLLQQDINWDKFMGFLMQDQCELDWTQYLDLPLPP